MLAVRVLKNPLLGMTRLTPAHRAENKPLLKEANEPGGHVGRGFRRRYGLVGRTEVLRFCLFAFGFLIKEVFNLKLSVFKKLRNEEPGIVLNITGELGLNTSRNILPVDRVLGRKRER